MNRSGSLRAITNSANSKARRRSAVDANRTRRRRLLLEQLENRSMLATFNVTANVADGAAGSLRAAITAANSNNQDDTINLAGGTYVLTQWLSLTESGKTITFQGDTAANTIVDANHTGRVFGAGYGVTAVFNDLTIKNGGADSTRPTGAGIDGYYATITVNDSIVIGNRGYSGGGIYVNPGTLTINNSQITGNDTTRDGGGVFVQGGTVTISNSTIESNTAGASYQGGGLYLWNATAILDGTTIQQNSAGNGGGIGLSSSSLSITDGSIANNQASILGGGIALNAPSAAVTITSASIAGNSAPSGGGIHHGGGSAKLTLIETSLAGNSATSANPSNGEGGGILTFKPLEIIRSTISGNSATRNGGGVWSYDALTVTNSTVSGNSAATGGGLYVSNYSNTASVLNSTITANSSSGGGGGIALAYYASISMKNSILTNNTGAGSPPDLSGGNATVASQGYNLFGSASISSYITGVTTGNLLGVDAKLSPLADNGGQTLTHALLSSSPAIDAGTSSGAPSVDQRNQSRQTGTSLPDIGAFEYVLTNPDPVAATDSFATDEDTAITVSSPGVLANDIGNGLTASLLTGPQSGTLNFNSDGSFVYTPIANFNGSVSFTYKASNGSKDSGIGTVNINVVSVNDPPVAASDAFEMSEDTCLNLFEEGLLLNDSDADTSKSSLSVVLTADVDSEEGLLTLNPDGTFSFIAEADYFGQATFKYKVFDGKDYSNEATATLTVTPVADAPLAIPDAQYSVAEDSPLTVSSKLGVLANDQDADKDPLVAEFVSGPSTGGTLDFHSDGSFDFMPSPDTNGPYTFTYRVNDGLYYSNEVDVTITVSPVNDDPVAISDNYSATGNSVLDVAAPGLTANDTDVDAGDSKAVTAFDSTSLYGATVAVSSNGSFSYDPRNSKLIRDLDEGQSLQDQFTYTISDSKGSTSQATVTITVAGVDDPPTTLPDQFTVAEDAVLSIAVQGVLANDADAEGDSIAVAVEDLPAHGTLVLNENGSFTYTPVANFSGSDSFTYVATSNGKSALPETVTLSITEVDDLPTAGDDAYSLSEDALLQIAGPGLLVNDIGGDGVLSATPVQGTTSLGARYSVNSDGSITYDPATSRTLQDLKIGEELVDTISYFVRDIDGSSDEGVITITVTGEYDAPTAIGDGYLLTEDTVLNMDVLANDRGGDGEPLVLSIVDGPAYGTLQFNFDGSIEYAPNPDYFGADTFSYLVSVGTVSSESVTVFLTVEGVNDSPIGEDDYLSLDEDALYFGGNVLANDSDADGLAQLEVSLVSGVNDGNLILYPDGSFYFTPDPNFNGSAHFVYSVTDGFGMPLTFTAWLMVNPVNDAPTVLGESYSPEEDTPFTVTSAELLSNDDDIDGDALTASLQSDAQHGTVTVSSEGLFTYTPGSNYSGPDSFIYLVSDGSESVAATVNFTVVPGNDPPVTVDDALSTDEDVTLSFNLNDLVANDSDIDGQSLMASIGEGPAHGTLSVDSSGMVNYIPAADYFGPDSFTYTASDGIATATATVNLTVNSVNDAPVVASDTFSVAEDAVTVTGNVLGNDTDIDGPSTLIAVLVGTTTQFKAKQITDPLNPTDSVFNPGGSYGVTLAPNGDFTATIPGNFWGTLSVEYRAFDGANYSDVALISFDIAPSQDPPKPIDDHFAVPEDAVEFLGDVRANDTDPDGDPISAALVSGVSHGTLIFNADGTFNYTPKANFNGQDSFAYSMSDGTSLVNATAFIDVKPAAEPSGNTSSTIYLGAISGVLPVVNIRRVQDAIEGGNNGKFELWRTGGSLIAPLTVYLKYDGSATEGIDYAELPRSVVIPAHSASTTFDVSAFADTDPEIVENVWGYIKPSTNYAIGIGSSYVNILDQLIPTGSDFEEPVSPLPKVTVSDAVTLEGGNLAFIFTLSPEVDYPVTVQYSTREESAISPEDFGAVDSEFTFIPHQTSWTVVVSTVADTVPEVMEHMLMVIDDVTGASVSDGYGQGDIRDPKPPLPPPTPLLFVSDAQVVEGGQLAFIVSISGDVDNEVTLDLTTVNGSAVSPADYISSTEHLTFAPRSRSKVVYVNTNEDGIAEGMETLTFEASNVVGVGVGDGIGQGQIVDKTTVTSTLPQVSIMNAAVGEGGQLEFKLLLSPDWYSAVTVVVKTFDHTAQSPADYEEKEQAFTFAPGQREKIFVVATQPDLALEDNETMRAKITHVSGADIGIQIATGTIIEPPGPIPFDVEIKKFFVGATDTLKIGGWTTGISTGYGLIVDYEVSGEAPSLTGHLALMTSTDGVETEDTLESFVIDLSPGKHQVLLKPTFTDIEKDYYLVSFVDTDFIEDETNQDNNQLKLERGTFTVEEAASGNKVTHIHGTPEADQITVKSANNSYTPMFERWFWAYTGYAVTGQSSNQYDVTGDGVVDNIDIAAAALPLYRVFDAPFIGNTLSWAHNATNPADVDGSGTVTAADANWLANRLATGQPSQGLYGTAWQFLQNPLSVVGYLPDVTDDGFISIADLDAVNNALQPGSAPARPWRNATNPADVDGDGELTYADPQAIASFLGMKDLLSEPNVFFMNDVFTFGVFSNLVQSATGYWGIRPPAYGKATGAFGTTVVPETHIRPHDGDDLVDMSGYPGDAWIFGGEGDDVLTGADTGTILPWSNGGDDIIYGGSGDDVIWGLGGDDILIGGIGNDTIEGSPSFDAELDTLHLSDVFEGERTTLSGTYTDYDSSEDRDLYVDWNNDGTWDQKVTVTGGTFSITQLVEDDDPGTGTTSDPLTVRASFVESGSSNVTQKATATMFNVSPQLTGHPLLDFQTNTNGQSVAVITVPGMFDPGTKDSHQISVQWADGVVSTSTSLTSQRTISNFANLLPLTITPKDDDNGQGSSYAIKKLDAWLNEDEAGNHPLVSLNLSDLLTLDMVPSLGTFQLSYDSRIVRIWDSPAKSNLILPGGDSAPEGQSSIEYTGQELVWVEGLDFNTTTITLAYYPSSSSATAVYAGSVLTTVWKSLDLDVDSDNNNGFDYPRNTPWEEYLEDNEYAIGKMLSVGDSHFTPMRLRLPKGLDLDDPTLKITISQDISASGVVRLWNTHKSDSARLPAGNPVANADPNVHNGGNLLGAMLFDSYTLKELKYDPVGGGVTLWMDATSVTSIHDTKREVDVYGKPDDRFTAEVRDLTIGDLSDQVKYMVVYPDSFYPVLNDITQTNLTSPVVTNSQAIRNAFASEIVYGTQPGADPNHPLYGYNPDNPNDPYNPANNFGKPIGDPRWTLKLVDQATLTAMLDNAVETSGFDSDEIKYVLDVLYNRQVEPTFAVQGLGVGLYLDHVSGIYVLSFRGTNFKQIIDWIENLSQASAGFGHGYKAAIRLGSLLKSIPELNLRGPMQITGHSLGGGLASAASISSGLHADTFNASGLVADTLINPEDNTPENGNEWIPGSLQRLAQATNYVTSYQVWGQSRTGSNDTPDILSFFQWYAATTVTLPGGEVREIAADAIGLQKEIEGVHRFTAAEMDYIVDIKNLLNNPAVLRAMWVGSWDWPVSFAAAESARDKLVDSHLFNSIFYGMMHDAGPGAWNVYDMPAYLPGGRL